MTKKVAPRGTVVVDVHDIGDDVLIVRGTIDGQPVETTGWVSALDSYIDPAAYGPDGHRHDDKSQLSGQDVQSDDPLDRLAHRHDGKPFVQVDEEGNEVEIDSGPADGHTHKFVKPRKMTKAEQLTYCKGLLEETAARQPRKLAING
jgi:hypothetical protein